MSASDVSNAKLSEEADNKFSGFALYFSSIYAFLT